jgi:hypothetical protein
MQPNPTPGTLCSTMSSSQARWAYDVWRQGTHGPLALLWPGRRPQHWAPRARGTAPCPCVSPRLPTGSGAWTRLGQGVRERAALAGARWRRPTTARTPGTGPSYEPERELPGVAPRYCSSGRNDGVVIGLNVVP